MMNPSLPANTWDRCRRFCRSIITLTMRLQNLGAMRQRLSRISSSSGAAAPPGCTRGGKHRNTRGGKHRNGCDRDSSSFAYS